MPSFEYLDLLGIPFERGARGPDAYDCYGFVIEMFRRKGVIVPDFDSPGTLEEIESLVERTSMRWRRVAPRTPGSLITFRVEGFNAHVGFMLEGDMFAHAIEPTGVTVERLTSNSIKPVAFYDFN